MMTRLSIGVTNVSLIDNSIAFLTLEGIDLSGIGSKTAELLSVSIFNHRSEFSLWLYSCLVILGQ